MRLIGVFIMVFGILGVLLQFADAGLIYFNWAERWGQAAAFGIKMGVVLLGFLLWRFGPKR